MGILTKFTKSKLPRLSTDVRTNTERNACHCTPSRVTSSHSSACKLATKKKWQKIKQEEELLEKVIKREDDSDKETDLDKTIEYIKEE